MIVPEDYKENKIMKLFEIHTDGEKECIGAKNPIEALKYYLDLSNSDLESVDDIREIPKKNWKYITIKNNDYDEEFPEDMPESWTAEELMQGLTSPEYISSTSVY